MLSIDKLWAFISGGDSRVLKTFTVRDVREATKG